MFAVLAELVDAGANAPAFFFVADIERSGGAGYQSRRKSGLTTPLLLRVVDTDFMANLMPMDPALRKFLDESAAPAVDPHMQNDEIVRMRRAVMTNALATRVAIPGLPNNVMARDVEISPQLNARLYSPPDAARLDEAGFDATKSEPRGTLPVMVYMHGGGWVVGSIETHDPFCRLFCEAAGVQILSLGYRLAPEHPFPAALEDVLAACAWVVEHAASFGGDPRRILLGGDSAGANLAAVTANRLCAADGVRPAALMLLYPVADHPSAEHGSYKERGQGCGLDAWLMRWFWDQYVPASLAENAEVSPLRLERVPALPPTLVATAEYDPLRDEGVQYAEKLKSLGVEVTHIHAADMHHNFPVHPGTVALFPQSVAALREIAAWIRNAMRST